MNLFNKLKKVAGIHQAETAQNSQSKNYVILQDDPNDVVFAKKLIQNNGIFFYCDKKDNLIQIIQALSKKLNIENIYCIEPLLKDLLSSALISYKDSDCLNCHAVLSSCEYLIANQGKIMLSSKQLASNDINNLPKEHIVIAYTSQIVRNLNEAMSGVNTRYIDNLPSTITTITGNIKNHSITEGNVKNLSVILIEDFEEKIK